MKEEGDEWYASSATKRTRGLNFFLMFCKYQWFSVQDWYNLSYTVVSADVLQLQYESLGNYSFSFINNFLQQSCTWARLLSCITKTQTLRYLSYASPAYKSGTRPFFRWVRSQGWSLHTSCIAKNTFGPVGISLIRDTWVAGQ